MESRKKRNLEIERKRKQKQRVFTTILTVLIGLAVFGLCYAFWDIMNRRTVMTFEGERIATSDFRFWHMMMGMPEGEEAQAFALDNLLQTLVLMQRAEQHGLSLTDEESAEMLERARAMREEAAMQMPGGINFISERRLAEILGALDVFYKRLGEIYVPDEELEIDSDEIDEMIQDLMHWIILYDENTQIDVKYMIHEDRSALESAQAMLADGAEFDDVIREFDMYYVEGEEIAAVSMMEFLQTFNIGEEISDIIALNEGEVSQIITVYEEFYEMVDGSLEEFEAITMETFILVQMYERVVDQESVDEFAEQEREYYRQERFSDMREELFLPIIEEWKDAANYTVNDRALRRF